MAGEPRPRTANGAGRRTAPTAGTADAVGAPHRSPGPPNVRIPPSGAIRRSGHATIQTMTHEGDGDRDTRGGAGR